MTERTRVIYAYAEMAQVAEDVRKHRTEGDPAPVDAGKLYAGDAATCLRVSTAIATNWKAYTRMEVPSLNRTTDAENVANLKTVLIGAGNRRDQARLQRRDVRHTER